MDKNKIDIGRIGTLKIDIGRIGHKLRGKFRRRRS